MIAELNYFQNEVFIAVLPPIAPQSRVAPEEARVAVAQQKKIEQVMEK